MPLSFQKFPEYPLRVENLLLLLTVQNSLVQRGYFSTPLKFKGILIMSKQKGVFPCFSRKLNGSCTFLSNKTLTSIFQRRKGRYNNIYKKQHCPIEAYY